MSEMLSPRQAAEKLGVCTKTILSYIKDGRLSAKRYSKSVIRIPADALNDLDVSTSKESA